MTPEQLEAQSRAAIIARLNDPSVKLEVMNKLYEGWLLLNVNAFDLDCAYYRIAKPRKFYRVGKFINGVPFIVHDSKEEEYWRNQDRFKEWLDERKYYD